MSLTKESKSHSIPDSKTINQYVSSSNKNKLSIFIKKQLAKNMKRCGVIDQLCNTNIQALNKLITKQPEVYDNIPRHPIQKFFWYWRKLKKNEKYYKNVLCSFRIKSYQQKQKEEKAKAATKASASKQSSKKSSIVGSNSSEDSYSSNDSASNGKKDYVPGEELKKEESEEQVARNL